MDQPPQLSLASLVKVGLDLGRVPWRSVDQSRTQPGWEMYGTIVVRSDCPTAGRTLLYWNVPMENHPSCPAKEIAMTLDLEDRIAIYEVLALHGHLSDNGETSRFHEVFSEDVTYDLSALGRGVLTGLDALTDGKQTAVADPRNPIAQHLTNVVLTPESPDSVRSISKSLGVRPDGTCLSVTYHDVLHRRSGGWRIARRSVSAP